jgi:hypothetical protein
MIAFGQTRRQMIVVTAVPVADISVMVGVAVVTVSMPVAVIMIVVGTSAPARSRSGESGPDDEESRRAFNRNGASRCRESPRGARPAN